MFNLFTIILVDKLSTVARRWIHLTCQDLPEGTHSHGPVSWSCGAGPLPSCASAVWGCAGWGSRGFWVGAGDNTITWECSLS